MRISRACSEMGIRSAAIYTDADRWALHVKKADEAYRVGSDPILGYLNVQGIVALAVENKCDAIHPGYGFLSENPALARLCKEKGVIFIGPDENVIFRMGDKIQARKAMIAAGIPVVPGSEGNLQNLEETRELARKIGYPVMLKATNGGGGRGIRRCNSEEELIQNYDRVISEAEKAFGKPEVFLEKSITAPRHIEVQILGDQYGNVIHLFERDCSIQRRNQKLIEIAPSPVLTDEQRNYIGELAIRAAKYVNYTNAGTVEFLLDQSNNFYFMEMNTRLQVEHPITEQITGIDLVQQQIRIARGEKLAYRQSDISYRGYSMEFRINIEDPKNDFLPNFGRITRYYAPGGPGVRTDAAIYTGYDIPPYYDSMVAKLVVRHNTWEGLIMRGKRALDDMTIFGVKTTMPYYVQILNNAEFQAGKFDTAFVANHPELADYKISRPREFMVAALSAAIAASEGL